MNQKIWERKVRELQSEKLAAGDYISKEDAEKIISKVFGHKKNLPKSDYKDIYIARGVENRTEN